MTARIQFTEASLKRAIAAVRSSGLHVVGVKPDGTLIVSEEEIPHSVIDSTRRASKWDSPKA